MTHTYRPDDYAHAGNDIFGSLPRYWQTEETAYLTLDAGAGTLLRVPLYVAPNPTSAMTGGTSGTHRRFGVGNRQRSRLRGTGVCTGR